MLDKELDKLRDKTLSFGCFFIKSDGTAYRNLGMGGTMPASYEILGHPLTRGRICYLHEIRGLYNVDVRICFREVENIFCKHKELYNQSELERMQSPDRKELKELLIQFSNYL